MDREKLLRIIEEGNSPHAILLAGPPDSDQSGLARLMAARFLLHSDEIGQLETCPFYTETGDYAIDSLRDALRLLNAEAYERGRRCILLRDAHRMSQLVQNVLLKTLEEPTPDTLILLTGVESGMLPTILSRCMILRSESEPWQAIRARLIAAGIDASVAEHCARRSDGVFGRAERMAGEDALTFRKGAIDCLKRYAGGLRPLPEAAALCTRTEASEEEGESKKRSRVSAELVDALFDIWSSVLGDALKRKVGWDEIDNTDCKPLVKNLADGFTTAQIQGMIQTLSEGKRRLYYKATASLTLDWVLCRMP